MLDINQHVKNINESVFTTVTRMANENEAINLAQGFPDFDCPQWIVEAAQKVMSQEKNQYAPSYGIPQLRKQVSQLLKNHYDLDYAFDSEVLITNGATEAIYLTLKAILNPGDEVIAFEPFYDSYSAVTILAGAELKPVTLKYPEFKFCAEEFESQITEKTKLLILNNPHNPTGRVFSKDELEWLADKAEEHDFYIMSDEVYEFLTYGAQHIPVASVKNLRKRTFLVSSVSKTLSLTGWKVGWVCAPAELLKPLHNIHQYVAFCVAHPLQEALAQSLHLWEKELPNYRKEYSERMSLLVDGIQSLGAPVVKPEGSYFAVLQVPQGQSDWSFSEKLIKDFGVATLPLSPFYSKSNEGNSLVRLCFSKQLKTLQAGVEKITKFYKSEGC